MIRSIYYIILFVFVIGTTYQAQDSVKVYLINQAWHVGFLIQVDSITISQIPIIKDFTDFKFVDIGWGDEDFYQDDGINYYYGAKAMLVPTSSVIKITGHISTSQSILNWSEDSREVMLSSHGYKKLLNFIEASFEKGKGKYVETSRLADGAIRFYKSGLSYHLFNTCNTWIAAGLKEAGLYIDEDGIITTANLFESIDKMNTK